MAKYKLLTQEGYSTPQYIKGEIYNESYYNGSGCYVRDIVKNCPKDWELIPELTEDELLIEEAKKRYPIGTRIYSAWNQKDKYEAVVFGIKLSLYKGRSAISCLDQYGGENCHIYIDGMWAEIIKQKPICTEKTIKLSLEQAKKIYGKNPEMDELLLANFSKEELTKKELPKTLKELKLISGYYIGNTARINYTNSNSCSNLNEYKNTFATEKQARSALAMAQLSQLMAIYNDGWEFNPDSNIVNAGFCICREDNRIELVLNTTVYHFLSFKNTIVRHEFMKNFEPLIKEYLMID